MDRKKRLEKGIESLEKRIEEHKNKIKKYLGEGGTNPDLIAYWQGETKNFQKEIKKKEKQLDRKK